MSTQAYIGARKEIAFTKETVRGTAVGYNTGDWQPHLGYDFKPMVEKVKYEPGMGRIDVAKNNAIVATSSEGSVPLSLTKEFAGHILNMIFGKAPSTSGAGPYTHAYDLANNNSHLTYTVTLKDPIKGFVKYPFAMVNEVTFDFAANEITKATLGLMAGGEASATPGATTYSATDTYFLPKHLEVKFANDVAGLAAATEVLTDTLSITFAKNLVKEYALGSTSPVDIINQQFGVALALTTHYEDTTLRDWANSEVNKAMQVKLDDGAGTSLTFVFPKVAFETWADTNDNNNYLKNSVAIFAERDDTNGTVTAELVNTVASY